MKRVLISAAVAAAVALPAVIGLWGNASFSQAVPVRAPAAGQVVAPSPTPGSTAGTVDDNGGDTPRDQRTEPGDDRDAQGGTATPAPSPSATAPGADDNGGEVPRDQRVEPGDDRDTSGSSGSGSSGSGSSGSGSSGGDDHGGHGSDD